jgi:hypothetical protein
VWSAGGTLGYDLAQVSSLAKRWGRPLARLLGESRPRTGVMPPVDRRRLYCVNFER